MKKVLAVLALFVSATSLVNASTGKITFTGSIVESACGVSTLDSSQLNIIMPTVSETALNAQNKTAGRTPIAFNLSNCKGRSLNVHFDVVSSSNLKTGRLKNTSGSEKISKNVEIQLVNERGLPINVTAMARNAKQSNGQSVEIRDNSTILNYAAEYYATGAARTGDISSTALYTIVYH